MNISASTEYLSRFFHFQHKGCGQISLAVHSGEGEGTEPVTGTAGARLPGSMAVIFTVSS